MLSKTRLEAGCENIPHCEEAPTLVGRAGVIGAAHPIAPALAPDRAKRLTTLPPVATTAPERRVPWGCRAAQGRDFSSPGFL